MKKYSRKKSFTLLVLILAFFYVLQSISLSNYPNTINIPIGEDKNLEVSFPYSLSTLYDEQTLIKSVSNINSNKFKKTYTINGVDEGIAKYQLNFLGILPVKKLEVNVVNRKHLIPGGNAIGVRLNTKGVLVVAITDVIGIDGKKYSPAKEAGIKNGDSILTIDNIKVKDANHVVELLNDNKKEKRLILIERNGIQYETEIEPVKSLQDNSYRLGIWVRDKTAGIGTLTFYDKESKVFGALGHGITDIDTGNLLDVEHGKIMNAKIANIEQGTRGNPGEIKGIFYETNNILGEIHKNSNFGIYGKIKDNVLKNSKKEALPIGFKEEVKEGKAYILSTIEDDKVEKFEIEILKTQMQDNPGQKSMTIKIKDKKLLEKTGGIVQGMSGSPIIQNGKLIGAITHVFVNDPTKGYGIYIEWMLNQIDTENYTKKMVNSIKR